MLPTYCWRPQAYASAQGWATVTQRPLVTPLRFSVLGSKTRLGSWTTLAQQCFRFVLGFVAEGYIADWWPLAIARTPVQTRVARL